MNSLCLTPKNESSVLESFFAILYIYFSKSTKRKCHFSRIVTNSYPKICDCRSMSALLIGSFKFDCNIFFGKETRIQEKKPETCQLAETYFLNFGCNAGDSFIFFISSWVRKGCIFRTLVIVFFGCFHYYSIALHLFENDIQKWNLVYLEFLTHSGLGLFSLRSKRLPASSSRKLEREL